MADKELASITAADALTGAELLIVVQGGNSRKATAADLAALALADLDTTDFVLVDEARFAAEPAAIASSGTTDVLAAASLFVAVSGTTTITSLGTGANRLRVVRFTGSLTLTYNATSLILPGAADIQTAAGDVMIIASDASSNVRVIAYQRASGGPIQTLGAAIVALSVDSTPDANADYVPTYDASGTVGKRVLMRNLRVRESILIAVSDEITAISAGTNKIKFRMPYAFKLLEVRASLNTAQSSGSAVQVDINEENSSVLSTKLTIDNGEKTSTTAGTQPVISDSDLADDAEIEIDIDTVGDGTAVGLKVALIGYRTG